MSALGSIISGMSGSGGREGDEPGSARDEDGLGVEMKMANKWLKRTGLLLLASLSLLSGAAYGIDNPISPAIRHAAVAQAKRARSGGEVCVTSLLKGSLPTIPMTNLKVKGTQGIMGNISLVVGGRNFTAADVDEAAVPFYTFNALGLEPLLHDGGEWVGTGGNTDADDGQNSFGNTWAGEFYDLDKNNHYPKAILRYIGSHCYIFVPPMFFPTLPRGISSTEDTTPAPDPSWGMYWPDTQGWGGDLYYYAVATGVKTLDPRFVLGADKNLARLKLKEFADEFDSNIYPKMREYFGTEPDVDSDAKVFILLDDIRDGAGSFRGYFWAGNQYSRSVQAASNEKELLYIDLFPTFLMDPKQGYRTTAHEFTHMIHFNEGTQVVNNVLVEEERWLEEGFTQYASYLYDKSHTTNVDEFIKDPDTILVEPRVDVWLGNDPFANYGASYLFMFYLMEHYGGSNGATFMRNLVKNKNVGVKSVNDSLKGFSTDMEQVFGDWAIANFIDKERKLDQSSLNDGKWGYAIDNDYDTTNNMGVNQSLPVKFSEQVYLAATGMARSANVHPWAADYIQISGSTGNLNLGFDGDDRTTFKLAVIKRGPQVDPTVEYMYLNEKQAGNLLIQNYGAGNTYENLVLVPMVIANANYEKMNYVYSGSFSDLKVAVFPNPIYENYLHIVVRTNDKFSATPRVQMTFNGQQGYLTMNPVNDSTYITNYTLTDSGEGTVEAFGTNSNGTIMANTLKFSAVYYPAKSSGLLMSSFAELAIPEGATKMPGYSILSISSNQDSFDGLMKLTSTIDVGIPDARTAVPLKISIPSKEGSRITGEKPGLFEVTTTGPKYLGPAQIVDGKITGSIDTSASVFAAIDMFAPVLDHQGESQGKGVTSIKVTEKGSGIDTGSISVSYKGAPLPVSFDSANSRLLVQAKDLLDGEYPLDVSVSDKLGNTTKAQIWADVSGSFSQAQIVTYPNPARTFATIRAAFAGPDSGKLQVQATVRDTAGDEVFWTALRHQGGGLYEASWNLTNQDGKAVSNGVYYVEVEAGSALGDAKERRKMVVLR